MKKLNRIFVIACAMIGYVSGAFAQASATASASATIITPISISKTADLNFGNVAVSATVAGTAVITPAGVRSATLGVTLPATSGTVSAASFTVTGAAGYSYVITLPSSALTITNGSNTMTVTTFVSSPATNGTLTGGTQTLTVGATLNVDAGQAAGLYTSETPFSVTVNYN